MIIRSGGISSTKLIYVLQWFDNFDLFKKYSCKAEMTVNEYYKKQPDAEVKNCKNDIFRFCACYSNGKQFRSILKY